MDTKFPLIPSDQKAKLLPSNRSAYQRHQWEQQSILWGTFAPEKTHGRATDMPWKHHLESVIWTLQIFQETSQDNFIKLPNAAHSAPCIEPGVTD